MDKVFGRMTASLLSVCLALAVLFMVLSEPAFAGPSPVQGTVPGGAYVTMKVNKNGALIGRGNDNNDWVTTVSLANGTSTALKAAPGAGLKACIRNIKYQGIAATTVVTLALLDGVTSKMTFNVPAGVSDINFQFDSPLCASANAALNAQLSGSPTGAVQVNGTGFTVTN